MITTYDTIYVEDIEYTFKVDTTWEEVVNTTLNVGSQMGGGNTKAYVKVDLPSNTSTWVYWIGVGQEAVEALKELSKSISGVSSLLGTLDPSSALVAYGLGLITDLSLSLKSKDDINYIYFIFTMGIGNNIIKKGTRVVADYGKMTYPTEGTVYIMLDNSYSVITNKLVNVRVVAIRTLPQYEKRKVRKVKEIRERSYPKLD